MKAASIFFAKFVSAFRQRLVEHNCFVHNFARSVRIQIFQNYQINTRFQQPKLGYRHVILVFGNETAQPEFGIKILLQSRRVSKNK